MLFSLKFAEFANTYLASLVCRTIDSCMTTINKEDVQKAFASGLRGRNQMLYSYYKDQFFSDKLPNAFIAQKISEDLNYPITAIMIKMIRLRIINKIKGEITASKEASKSVSQSVGKDAFVKSPLAGEKAQPVPEQKKEFEFLNSDEIKRKENPFAKLRDY